MAKKRKKKPLPPKPLTEEQFIRLKMRSLPITECLMETGWEERGLCCIVVSRQHPNGKITMGVFLVDNFCLGLKETHYFFEIPDEDYATRIGGDVAMKKVSYEEVHNFIYGAIAFAEEVGIKPAKSFELTQYILEEDTEDIPLIEYPYGKRCAFVMGSERYGISRGWYDKNVKLLSIPMFGKCDSLNVGVAATVVCYEASLKNKGYLKR